MSRMQYFLDVTNAYVVAELNIKEGDFLMFPTHLAHRVIPQKVSDIPRITISFNLRVLEYGNHRSS